MDGPYLSRNAWVQTGCLSANPVCCSMDRSASRPIIHADPYPSIHPSPYTSCIYLHVFLSIPIHSLPLSLVMAQLLSGYLDLSVCLSSTHVIEDLYVCPSTHPCPGCFLFLSSYFITKFTLIGQPLVSSDARGPSNALSYSGTTVPKSVSFQRHNQGEFAPHPEKGTSFPADVWFLQLACGSSPKHDDYLQFGNS